MAANHRIWSGPYAADLRGRAIEALGSADGITWIVPSAMARDDLIRDVARRRTSPVRPRVLAWSDLWDEVARRHPRPPVVLSAAAARSAIVAAIGIVGDRGELGALERVADRPGTRRLLRGRFDAWTAVERNPSAPPPPDGDDLVAASWTIYAAYRGLLAETRSVDSVGLAAWASLVLDAAHLPGSSVIVFLDPTAPLSSVARRRAVDWARRTCSTILVTLPASPDPDEAAVAPFREGLLENGFAEVEVQADLWNARARLEGVLLDRDDHRPELGTVAGLSLLGGPEGEGLGLVLAGAIRDRIEAGSRPDDLLVLVRRWDDDATRALEIARSWGIPASGGPTGPLAAEPAVAALRHAVEVADEGWEATRVLRLLRNGQVDPPWGEAGTPDARAEAAATLRTLRVFRGLPHFVAALERRAFARDDDEVTLSDARPTAADRDRARRALGVVERLAGTLAWPPGPAPWDEQVARLSRLAEGLGLGASRRDREAIDALLDALDDHARFLEPGETPDLAAFARALGSLANEVPGPRWDAPSTFGSVRFAEVDEAAGARARVVFLTNLAEGTFPNRDASTRGSRPAGPPDSGDFALDPELGPDAYLDPDAEPLAYAAERWRFLRALASGGDEAVLLVPTTDSKGQDRLAAGFVDDVRRCLGVGSEGFAPGTIRRLDPTFREHPELARSPANARAFAVASACVDRRTGAILAVGRRASPLDAVALAGTAAGLRGLHDRTRVDHFTRHDGWLGSAGVVERIAAEFGADRVFSPSQLESFALCPFQFYQRYVLKLTPTDDRPELRTDHAGQGTALHRALEEVHAAIAAEGPDADLTARIEAHIATRTRMEVELDLGDEPRPRGDVAVGLRLIEDARIARKLATYVAEFRRYAEGDGSGSRPRFFELRFGLDEGGDPASPTAGHPVLDLGEGTQGVKIRGTIDRVDAVADANGEGFRIIDYKTGSAPGSGEVTRSLRAVQLPLYALAVERFLHGGATAGPTEFGYWGLGQEGWKGVKLPKGEDWPAFRDRVVAEVLTLAGMLRSGVFAVKPASRHCTRTCDYKVVCRIGQVRHIDKGPIREEVAR